MEEKDYRPFDYDAVEAFNGKKVAELNPQLQEMIKNIFPRAEDKDVIACGLCDRYDKPDIWLEVGEEKQFISLKSGHSKTIHYEDIRSFIYFLRGLGISADTQRTLLLYQYGDMTLNGVGPKRYESGDLLKMMPDRIARANRELNSRDIVRKCFRRFVRTGSEKRTTKADYIAYGNHDYFVYSSIKSLESYVVTKGFNHIKTLHIGPMIFGPWMRNLKRNPDSDWKRDIVHINWPYLLTDLELLEAKRTQKESE